jgi:hypothetical protein
MITEKTIATWTTEFVRVGKDSKGKEKPNFESELLEWMLKQQGAFLADEPLFAALVSTIFNMMDYKNALTAAFYALGLYHVLKKRQKEADELEGVMRE